MQTLVSHIQKILNAYLHTDTLTVDHRLNECIIEGALFIFWVQPTN